MIEALAHGIAARAVHIPRVALPAYVRLDIPQDADPGPDGDYRTLRIFDDRGDEIAYALDPTMRATARRELVVGDLAQVTGRYTEAILDARGSDLPYDAVTLETTDPDFFNRVEIAISDDRATWRIVRDDALIYRVARTDRGSQTIAVAPVHAPWLRVRIFGATRFGLTGASIARGAGDAERVHRLRCACSVSHRSGATTLAFDLLAPNVEVAALRFDATQPEFAREVAIEASDDGRVWRLVAEGRIARYAFGAPQLTIDARHERARYLRAVVRDEDDRPILGLRATAYAPTHAIVFEAAARRTYELQWGVGDARTYDLPDRLAHDEPVDYLRATVGEPVVPHERRAQASSRPRSIWLAIAFCVALLAVGGVTFATLRGSPRSS